MRVAEAAQHKRGFWHGEGAAFGRLRRGLAGLLALGAALLTASVAAAQDGAIVQPGYAVVTGFSGFVANQAPPGADPLDYQTIDINGPSARTVDLSVLGPQGQESMVDKPFTAVAGQIGQVFGVAIDDADVPNIYVAASSAYGLSIYLPDPSGAIRRLRHGSPGAQFVPGQFGPPEQNGGPESIWKIDGATGEVTLFANVDGGTWQGPSGLGGLAYDPSSNQLYVAERGTGLIHRYGLDGTDAGIWDHGGQGLPAAGMAPVPFTPTVPPDINDPSFDTENPGTWGLAPPERRVFGLAVHDQRLYYGVAAGPQIWSVGLNFDGSFAGDARLEADVPSLQPGAEIASIAFDGQGKMYLAERGATTGDYAQAHLAEDGANRVLRFSPKPQGDPSPGFWIETPEQYAIGLPPQFNNANGGVALGYAYQQNGYINTAVCGATLWSTGERLLESGGPPGSFPLIDGLQGESPTLVEPQNMPPLRSWFVDYDDRPGNPEFRGYMGALTILSPCVRQGGWYPPPVITCPPGTLYRGGACVYPSCPPGYVLYRNSCVPPPMTCPRDNVFVDGRCMPVGCPPGLFETRAGYCVCPPGRTYYDGECVPICPPNFYRDRDGRCVPPPCPPGQWRDRDGRCIPPPCPRGYDRDFRGYCVPPCPENYRRDDNGRCVPRPCPPGQARDWFGRCVPQACPPGMTRDDWGRCVPRPCPPGQIRDWNGRCEPQPCPQGEVRDQNGRCVPRPCPQGQIRDWNGRCIPLPCPPGQIRDQYGRCVAKECPRDMIRDPFGHCVPPGGQCPDGFHREGPKCVPNGGGGGGGQCPDGFHREGPNCVPNGGGGGGGGECPDGFHRDGKRCVPNGGGGGAQCPDGFHREGPNCVPNGGGGGAGGECPDGFHRDRGKCVPDFKPPLQCRDGMHLQGNQCVPDQGGGGNIQGGGGGNPPPCPDGTHRVGPRCVPDQGGGGNIQGGGGGKPPPCPDGTHREGLRCVPDQGGGGNIQGGGGGNNPPPCPDGTHRQGPRCVPDQGGGGKGNIQGGGGNPPPCPDGTHRQGLRCVPDFGGDGGNKIRGPANIQGGGVGGGGGGDGGNNNNNNNNDEGGRKLKRPGGPPCPDGQVFVRGSCRPVQ